MEISQFGDFNGQAVKKFRLTNAGGFSIEVMNWGATLVKCTAPVPGEGGRDLMLGFPEFDEYPAKSPYFGATCGRFANRIANGQFEIDGTVHNVDRNQNGQHHLHGGTDNFSKRVWYDSPKTECNSVKFALVSDDGDQGYPGKVTATCEYQLRDDNCLVIQMRAATTETTLINLAHHSYWNLDSKQGGWPTVDQHRLWLAADHYLPTGAGQIPTGEIRPVDGTEFDFRNERQLNDAGEPNFDHCFCVAGASELRPIARLRSSDQRVSMLIKSNQPAVQFYSGFKLDIAARSGHIGPRSGLCLETEKYPNAPNEPNFPSAFLVPGQTYNHVMEHYFYVSDG